MCRDTKKAEKTVYEIARLNILICVVLLIFCGVKICQANENDNSTEILLERCRRDCAIYKNVMTCGKFKALTWINNIVQEKEYVYGSFKIIKIPSDKNDRFLPKLERKKKSLMEDTLHFLRESAEEMLTRRALVYTVDRPSGARTYGGAGVMILDDDELENIQRARTFGDTSVSPGNYRIFKKKKSIILPILILLNLLKLKLLLLPIFLWVHFIKKLLVLGSLLLPSILAHLRICKVGQQPYHHHYWAAAPPEYPVADYPAYGHESAWDHRNDVGDYGSYYGSGVYNPFHYYFQNYNKQRR